MEITVHEAHVIISVEGGKQCWERDCMETLDALEARQDASQPLVTRGACQYAKATGHGLQVARERLGENTRKRCTTGRRQVAVYGAR